MQVFLSPSNWLCETLTIQSAMNESPCPDKDPPEKRSVEENVEINRSDGATAESLPLGGTTAIVSSLATREPRITQTDELVVGPSAITRAAHTSTSLRNNASYASITVHRPGVVFVPRPERKLPPQILNVERRETGFPYALSAKPLAEDRKFATVSPLAKNGPFVIMFEDAATYSERFLLNAEGEYLRPYTQNNFGKNYFYHRIIRLHVRRSDRTLHLTRNIIADGLASIASGLGLNAKLHLVTFFPPTRERLCTIGVVSDDPKMTAHNLMVLLEGSAFRTTDVSATLVSLSIDPSEFARCINSGISHPVAISGHIPDGKAVLIDDELQAHL